MSIITKSIAPQYFDELAVIAFENYLSEKEHALGLSNEIGKEYFLDKCKDLFLKGTGRVAFENNKVIGYLAFYTHDNNAYSPLYGYGVRHNRRGEVISGLLKDTAAVLCKELCQSFRVNVYACDSDVLWTYIMSVFTMDITDVVRATAVPINAKTVDYEFKEIGKQDLFNYKADIIAFYRGLINHLRVSPVFYPCDEFLPVEDRFEDFMSDAMRIFAVFDGSKLIGMVGSEPPDRSFAVGDKCSMNLTDLFVASEYRRMGVGAALLEFANSELRTSGIQLLFVTHGTVNPTARGFWDKYFTNYSYTLTRKINAKMLGIIEAV